MDEFHKSIVQTFELLGEWVAQGCEAVLQEVEAGLVDVEMAVEACLEPMDGWFDDLDAMISQTSRPWIQTVSPVLQEHPACVGCCHYHGEDYGGHLLVCAMHPYGVEESSCSDWESVWQGGSN